MKIDHPFIQFTYPNVWLLAIFIPTLALLTIFGPSFFVFAKFFLNKFFLQPFPFFGMFAGSN
jgi:hypothetical protein